MKSVLPHGSSSYLSPATHMVAASLGEVVRRKFICCVSRGGEEIIQLWELRFGVVSCDGSHSSLVSHCWHSVWGLALSSENPRLFLPALATSALLFLSQCVLIKWGADALCRFEVRKWAVWKQTGFSGSFATQT